MPQFLVDWNNWWVGFWVAYPVIFWLAAGSGIALSLGASIRAKRPF